MKILKKIKEKIKDTFSCTIVSKEHAMWERVVDGTRARIAAAEESLIIERSVLEMAEGKLKDAK